MSVVGSMSRKYRRRQWRPTPVLLPGKSHGRRSLVGCSPWVTKSRTRLSDFTFTFHFHWRRKWQPTPVFLPGESQGRGSLVGCRLWGHIELDTTEMTKQQQHVSTCTIYCMYITVFNTNKAVTLGIKLR